MNTDDDVDIDVEIADAAQRRNKKPVKRSQDSTLDGLTPRDIPDASCGVPVREQAVKQPLVLPDI
jgi:hypothetical protein